MERRDIIVIGGSAGALEPLKTIVSSLPADFSGSIFVVIHIAPDAPGYLASHLAEWGWLPATHATDGESIQQGHIYVAPPDYHLTVEAGRVRVLRGPRENRHRPAIDPLLRTAARVYGERVVGVILSGRHDDGSAGLYAVKQRGGIAIVQDPSEAAWKEMPRRAIAYSIPQYVLQSREIALKLIDLVQSNQDELVMTEKRARDKSNGRIRKAKSNGRTQNENSAIGGGENEANLKASYADEGEGTPSVFACPECHGILWELKDGKLVQFRCRVGHTYGIESLREELSEASETALWAAMRALEEKAAMERRVAQGMAGDRKTAQRLRDQAVADDNYAQTIRNIIFQRDANLSPMEGDGTDDRVA